MQSLQVKVYFKNIIKSKYIFPTIFFSELDMMDFSMKDASRTTGHLYRVNYAFFALVIINHLKSTRLPKYTKLEPKPYPLLFVSRMHSCYFWVVSLCFCFLVSLSLVYTERRKWRKEWMNSSTLNLKCHFYKNYIHLSKNQYLLE